MVEETTEVKKTEETRQLRRSTFECRACGSGTENFLTLFTDGACSHCGNPAGVVVETSRPEDRDKIGRSVMIVSSQEDREKAKEIMKTMLDEGISVIDPTLVYANEKAGNRANVLAFLADECKYVLVIPTEKGALSEDSLISAAVSQAFDSKKSRVVPLYPDKSYVGKSTYLDKKMGIMWEGEGTRAWGKDRFIDHLKQDVRAQTSAKSE